MRDVPARCSHVAIADNAQALAEATPAMIGRDAGRVPGAALPTMPRHPRSGAQRDGHDVAHARPSMRERIDRRIFDTITARSLLYNACWEDPAVDRQALDLGADDRLLVIASAGCNALDYALGGAGTVHAVDANPRQIALLELKLAGIAALEHEDFFALFGHGFHPRAQAVYRDVLRERLSPFARGFWDERWRWFADPDGSFYFHGFSGWVARGAGRWFRMQPRLHEALRALFDAGSIERQRDIYDRDVAPRLWNRPVNWMLSRRMTMNLLGVPQPQRRLVEGSHDSRAAGFIRESIEYVVRCLPLRDNYFWRVYFTGRYERDCCPEYLTETGFATLRAGAADRVRPSTCTVTDFLRAHEEPLTRFVLLDHMDWMASTGHAAELAEEWEAILARAAPGARILLRSAQPGAAFLDALRIGPQRRPLRELLHFQDDLAARLHVRDRVHTYAGFVIADVPA